MQSRARHGAGLFLLLGWLGACSSFGGTDDSSGSGGVSDAEGAPDGSASPPVQGAAPITLTITAPAVIQTGTSADIEVSVVRDGPMGFGDDIHLELQSLADVTAQAVTIPPDHQTATMTIKVGANRKNGPTPFVILGTSGDSQASATFSALVRGPVGSLDTGFGTDGFFSLEEDSEAVTLLTDGSGKLRLAGRVGADVGVVALTDDGRIDTSYATNGFLRHSVGTLVSTYFVTPSPPNFFFYANIANSGVPSTILAKLTPTGLDNTFGMNGIATIAGLQSASAVGTTPPTVLPAGTLIAGRPDATQASSAVMLINDNGTANTAWPTAGRMAVSNDCGGATINTQCGPRALVPRPMSAFVYQCVNKAPSSILLVSDVTDDSNSQVTLPGGCTDIVQTAPGNFYVTGASLGAQLTHVKFTTIDTVFDGRAPTTNLLNAKRVIPVGDGASFIVAVEASNASHTAMGVWRLDAAGKTDLAFNPPNGFTVAPIAGTDVTVTSMIVDSQDRILVAGSNGHMVVARFWQ